MDRKAAGRVVHPHRYEQSTLEGGANDCVIVHARAYLGGLNAVIVIHRFVDLLSAEISLCMVVYQMAEVRGLPDHLPRVHTRRRVYTLLDTIRLQVAYTPGGP